MNAGGPAMMGGGGGNAGAQKRPLDGAGGNMEQKRARMEGPVVPPEMESLPQEGSSMDLEALKRRFEALQQEVRGVICASFWGRVMWSDVGVAWVILAAVNKCFACPAAVLFDDM
jgi:hypothetical protein